VNLETGANYPTLENFRYLNRIDPATGLLAVVLNGEVADSFLPRDIGLVTISNGAFYRFGGVVWFTMDPNTYQVLEFARTRAWPRTSTRRSHNRRPAVLAAAAAARTKLQARELPMLAGRGVNAATPPSRAPWGKSPDHPRNHNLLVRPGGRVDEADAQAGARRLRCMRASRAHIPA
jgi:hypothetical protein